MKIKHESALRMLHVWHGMKRRCNNPSDANYSRYGGRGIKVCERWQKNFMAFVYDMGSRSEGYQIHRINNDGNYEPMNCRWVKGEKHARMHMRRTHRAGKINQKAIHRHKAAPLDAETICKFIKFSHDPSDPSVDCIRKTLGISYKTYRTLSHGDFDVNAVGVLETYIKVIERRLNEKAEPGYGSAEFLFYDIATGSNQSLCEALRQVGKLCSSDGCQAVDCCGREHYKDRLTKCKNWMLNNWRF